VELALRERSRTQEGFVCGAWFHASEEKAVPLLALLGRSNRIFVTADSVSMTYEAVACGVPAIAVYPTNGRPNRRHEAQFQTLENKGALARIQLNGSNALAQAEPASGWQLVTCDSHEALAERALQRLGL
jgi:mitochondrial fission protein ELM1